jgi:hypothetical protein
VKRLGIVFKKKGPMLNVLQKSKSSDDNKERIDFVSAMEVDEGMVKFIFVYV